MTMAGWLLGARHFTVTVMEVDRAARGNGPTSSPPQGVIEAAETAVRVMEAKENLYAAETKDETRDPFDAAVKEPKWKEFQFGSCLNFALESA